MTALLALPAFAACWIGMSGVLARFEGWPRLAQEYRLTNRFPGTLHRFARVRMGSSPGHAPVVLGSSPEGLYLRGSLLHRVGRPPILVPWNEIHGERSPLGPYSMDADLRFFTLGSSARIRIGVAVLDAVALVAEAGLGWPLHGEHVDDDAGSADEVGARERRWDASGREAPDGSRREGTR